MKRWPLVLALLLSVGLNLGIVAALVVQRAQSRALPAGDLRAPQLEHVADRLGLEGSERSRFLAAQRRFLATLRREAPLLARARADLRHQLTAPSPDRARVLELVEITVQRSAAMDRAFAENVLVVREILEGPRERRYVRMLAEAYGRVRGGPHQRGR